MINNQMEIMRQFAGIVITLGLLAAALWALRRKGYTTWRRRSGTRVIEIIESRGLAPGHTLHLVRVADRVMALATHGSGCTLLESRPWTELQQALQTEVRP
jgi:flagellar biogenesis protein FliO